MPPTGSLEERLIRVEMQVESLARDLAASNEARSDAMGQVSKLVEKIDTRTSSLERLVYIGFGIVVALQLFLGIE